MVYGKGTGRLSLPLVSEAKQSQRLRQSTKATSRNTRKDSWVFLKDSSLLCRDHNDWIKRTDIWAEENLQSDPLLAGSPDLSRLGLPLQAHQAHKSRVPDHGEVATIKLGEGGPAK